MELSNVEGFPTEVATSVHNLDKAISTIEEAVAQLISTPLADAHSKLKPLERAKYDTAAVYSVTSLYWAFMKTRGIDPKAHGLLKELERVKDAVTRTKQISDRELAPKVNVAAAKRFIRQGLWEPSKDGQSNDEESADSSSPPKKMCLENPNTTTSAVII